MSRIWVRSLKKHKLLDQRTPECDRDGVEEALREACRDMDLPSPMWLKKQYEEFDKFGMTAFGADNFFEPIRFDRLEVSFLPDDGITRRSSDPRNDFSNF